MTEQKLFDKEELLDRIGGDQELMEQLIELYAEDYPSKLQAIKTALEKNDSELLHTSAHAIKGASGNLSFNSIYELCQSLEACGKDNRLDDAAKVLPELEDQLLKLKNLLNF